jgi:hypothetical protein
LRARRHRHNGSCGGGGDADTLRNGVRRIFVAAAQNRIAIEFADGVPLRGDQFPNAFAAVGIGDDL